MSGSDGAPPVPPRTKGQIPVLLLGWCPSTNLSSSSCETDSHLVSPPWSCNCTGRYRKPSRDVSSWRVGMVGSTCATWLGCKYCFMLWVVTRTLAGDKARDESVREDYERAIVCGHHMQNHSVSELSYLYPYFILSIVAIVTFICTKAADINSQSRGLPK